MPDERMYLQQPTKHADPKSVPIKGFTPHDLARHAEMIGRVIAPLHDKPDVVLKAGARGRPYAEVVVQLVGRPPLRITVEELP